MHVLLRARTKTMAAAASSRRTPVLFVLVDGIGDVSLSCLSGRTPLQHAKTPALDRLSQLGVNGLVDPVAPGMACGSDTAHLSLLGYPPAVHYRGRGCFEALGSGLSMAAGDIAFKSNFAVMQPESGTVTSRRCDRAFHTWGVALCDYLTGTPIPGYPNVRVDVKYATEHRCGVRLRLLQPGPHRLQLVDTISGTDPLKDNCKLRQCAPLPGISGEQLQHATFTAGVVNAVSAALSERLRLSPLVQQRKTAGQSYTNVVLLRGCGGCMDVPTFSSLHNDMSACMIAPTAIIAGLGESVGMKILQVSGATGDYSTDLTAKARAALAAIQEHDFCFLHVKAVDDAGHDKSVALKVEWLERVDKMVSQLVSALEQRRSGPGCVLCVTGDHSTPVLTGDHSCEPVPIAIACVGPAELSSEASELFKSDDVACFDEVAAARGVLGRFRGMHVMPVLKRLRLLCSVDK